MNGKHRTLLTWLGKSLRPVAMMASGRADGDLLGQDLRLRIGQRQDQRFRRHQAQPLRLQHAWRREPQEDIGIPEHVAQRVRVRIACVARHVGQHARAIAANHAVDVGQRHVLRPQSHRHQQIDAGQRRRARTRRHQPHIDQRLALQHQPVAHRRGDRDRRAMLVVVEHRDAHAPAQLRLDGEAFGRLDVLQIDRTEGRLQGRHHIAEARRVLGIDLDVEHVDASELLEQDGLALHHRLAGERADIAQAQHGRAVGDHRRPGCRGPCSHRRRADRRRWPRRPPRHRENRRATDRAAWPSAWSARSRAFPVAAADGNRAPPCGSRRPSATHPQSIDNQDERADTGLQRMPAPRRAKEEAVPSGAEGGNVQEAQTRLAPAVHNVAGSAPNPSSTSVHGSSQLVPTSALGARGVVAEAGHNPSRPVAPQLHIPCRRCCHRSVELTNGNKLAYRCASFGGS